MRLVNIRLVLILTVIATATNAAMAASKFPTIQTISPTTKDAGSATFTLSVSGTNFDGTDTVTWNGTALATTLKDSMHATAVVPASAVANAGTVKVAMRDSKTGKVSSSVPFTITQPTVISISITPNNATTTTNGTIGFTSTVSGTANTAVTWSVASGGGKVDSTGVYTAPSTAGSATIMATSAASPTSSALANVTINALTTMLVSASPTSISFGSVLVGSSATQAVMLTNTGNSSVTVYSASLTGTGFNLSGLSFPFTLAAGASQSANVIFAPSSSGTASGSVSFVSNATNSPATVAPLSGSGTAPVAPVQHTATLNWQPGSPSPAGYNVYRSTTSGGSYSRLNSTLNPTASYSDSTVASGQTYYWVVTEVSSSGMESAYSSQVSAVIPTP